MRKILITLVVFVALVATASSLWLFGGRQLSLFVDRFGTIETGSSPVRSLIYEGSGTGGIFVVNELHLNLDPADPRQAPPHIGTTKDGALGISIGGKVFPFGPLPAAVEGSELLVTAPASGDDASIKTRRSALGWFQRVTFPPLLCARYLYYQLVWQKSSGAKLEMLWRFEGHEGNAGHATGAASARLIKIDVHP